MTVHWQVYKVEDGNRSVPEYRATMAEAITVAAAYTREPRWYIKARLPDRRSDRSGKYDVGIGVGEVFIERVLPEPPR